MNLSNSPTLAPHLETETATVNELSFASSTISHSAPAAPERAFSALESGQLVVAPTETRYGLLCRADDEAAVERLYIAKKRSAELVMAVFLPTVGDIGMWAKLTPAAAKLQECFLPGPLTLVLPATELAIEKLSPRVIRRGEIGIRVTKADFVARLLERISFPVTATSANISGADTPANIQDVARNLGESVALYVDGGDLVGEVSTVVRCLADTVEVLRQGALTVAELQSALGEDIVVKRN